MTFPIRHHRPAPPRRPLSGLLWSGPALFAIGAMIGHLIEAAAR